jgi:hypothetical protein
MGVRANPKHENTSRNFTFYFYYSHTIDYFVSFGGSRPVTWIAGRRLSRSLTVQGRSQSEHQQNECLISEALEQILSRADRKTVMVTHRRGCFHVRLYDISSVERKVFLLYQPSSAAQANRAAIEMLSTSMLVTPSRSDSRGRCPSKPFSVSSS